MKKYNKISFFIVILPVLLLLIFEHFLKLSMGNLSDWAGAVASIVATLGALYIALHPKKEKIISKANLTVKFKEKNNISKDNFILEYDLWITNIGEGTCLINELAITDHRTIDYDSSRIFFIDDAQIPLGPNEVVHIIYTEEIDEDGRSIRNLSANNNFIPQKKQIDIRSWEYEDINYQISLIKYIDFDKVSRKIKDDGADLYFYYRINEDTKIKKINIKSSLNV